ncbi:hypothetical protein [Actinoplanes sp. URMC 104]|uniref:hypothetical protein n=1 Tax=Actinoplanes sp. URMC 104 TaxID=3423409 RepID=UPI003F1BF332
MRRPAYRRAAATPSGRNRRLFAAGTVIAALGAALGIAQISGAAENDPPEGSGAGKVVNGQVILTDTCADSTLTPHNGFQEGSRCISTEFGEVGEAKDNPSLLITNAPRRVAVNTPFTLTVSTRNLIRDRFLAAGKGGYYVESSVLRDGLVRGHFHTACRMLPNTNEAPAPDPVPAFFVATEDSKGGATPDEVVIQVPGLPTAGIAQCSSWAGDGSHRTPMMVRANQTPAIDAVRISVGNAGGGNTGGGNNGGGNNGGNTGGGNNGGNTGGGNNGGNTGGGNTGGNNGGNTGGNNNGGNTGGGNNGGVTPGNPNTTVAPTKPPIKTPTTGPTVKDDFTPDPTRPATTTRPKPGTTKPATTQPPVTEDDDTESGTVDNDTEAPAAEAPTTKAPATKAPATKAPKPRATTSAAAGTNYTYDDGQFNSGNKAPVADQVAQVRAESAKKDDGGLLAKTGTNTIAVIGGAAVLLMIGLIIMALTRRRSLPGTPWE